MTTAVCPKCGGKRWVRYFSETTDGDYEEAFGLCPCNSQPEVRGEDHREEPECAKNIAREKPASSHIKVIELRVELW